MVCSCFDALPQWGRAVSRKVGAGVCPEESFVLTLVSTHLPPRDYWTEG